MRDAGYLGTRQPVIKLGVAIGLSLALFLTIDPITPLLFLVALMAVRTRPPEEKS